MHWVLNKRKRVGKSVCARSDNKIFGVVTSFKIVNTKVNIVYINNNQQIKLNKYSKWNKKQLLVLHALNVLYKCACGHWLLRFIRMTCKWKKNIGALNPAKEYFCTSSKPTQIKTHWFLFYIQKNSLLFCIRFIVLVLGDAARYVQRESLSWANIFHVLCFLFYSLDESNRVRSFLLVCIHVGISICWTQLHVDYVIIQAAPLFHTHTNCNALNMRLF